MITKFIKRVDWRSTTITRFRLKNSEYKIILKDIKLFDNEMTKGKRMIIDIRHTRLVIYFYYKKK